MPDRETGRHRNGRRDWQTDRQMNGQMFRLTDKHTETWIDG